MKISIIVSIANNGCIGGNNTLLWKQSEDLKRFKELTTGKVVIMGQKTYESLPFKPLPKRTNIIITDDPDQVFNNCVTAYSIEDAIQKAEYWADEGEVFIIGGGSIYKQFLPSASKLYVTRIDADLHGDTYFPDIDEDCWTILSKERHEKDEKNQYNYTYEIYERS
jgi:dihydrofolate reductase